MVTHPAVHEPSTTVAQLREFFRDDHVHMALLVDDRKLIGIVARDDLTPQLSDGTPATTIAKLDGRTVRPDALLADAIEAMTRNDGRRLAVIDDDSTLLGILCLKASGHGFCSDADVASRAYHRERTTTGG